MRKNQAKAILSAVAFGLLTTPATHAQNPPPAPPENQSAAQYSSSQLDQMLAPIALYPDELVSSILTAATYPLGIVQTDRWLQQGNNRTLKGDQLEQALEQQPWDASVKSLIPFPHIIKMMDDNLEWTEKVGDAFLADQGAVMDSVQRLRRDAQAAGHLPSNAQEAVSTDGQVVVIQPTEPAVVYIPCYDPGVIYGAWPWPEYPPTFFPDYDCSGPFITFGIGFPFGPYWGWSRWDWHNHRLNIDTGRYNAINNRRPPVTSTVWQHNALDRHGVPYRDSATSAKFQPNQAAGSDTARTLRGYAPRGSTGVAPGEETRSVPVFEAPSPGSDVRGQSARGSMSRGSMPSGGFGGGARSVGGGGQIGGARGSGGGARH